MRRPIVPCRRPKVTVEDITLPAHRQGPEHGVEARCHVPGCGWSYLNVVKVDVQQQASFHRAAHTAVVPATLIEHTVEWDVHCAPCGGHRRTFGTRREAKAWLEDHLATEHGLVTCP